MPKNQITSNLPIPIYKLFPNLITVIGLCLGISALRYALDLKMEIAAALIVIAGFMDGIDGRIARLLNSASSFGAQLDSLADIVSFGVAPAIITYIWSLSHIPYKGVGWAVVLFYISCSALRLARFNVQSMDKESIVKAQYYFTGVPMPIAAILLLLPMISTFELFEGSYSPYHILIYMSVISILMISKIPTPSFKKINIKRDYVTFILVGAALLIVSLIIEPWIVLPLLGAVYIFMIPLTVLHYLHIFKKLDLK